MAETVMGLVFWGSESRYIKFRCSFFSSEVSTGLEELYGEVEICVYLSGIRIYVVVLTLAWRHGHRTSIY